MDVLLTYMSGSIYDFLFVTFGLLTLISSVVAMVMVVIGLFRRDAWTKRDYLLPLGVPVLCSAITACAIFLKVILKSVYFY